MEISDNEIMGDGKTDKHKQTDEQTERNLVINRVTREKQTDGISLNKYPDILNKQTDRWTQTDRKKPSHKQNRKREREID